MLSNKALIERPIVDWIGGERYNNSEQTATIGGEKYMS
jgi:hypothetical protein